MTTALTTQNVNIDGTPPAMGPAATSMTAEVGPGHKLVLHNGSGGSITVTIADPGKTKAGLDNPDKQYTVANGADLWPPLYDFYADPSDGLAHITLSSAATVTCASVKG